MLVYVFWHQPRPGIALDEYAGALLAFESVFKGQGDVEAIQSFRMESVPWFGSGARVYTDWYVMSDSSKLDPVNQHAISGPCEKPHQAIAAMTGAGTGSLYDITHSGCDVGEARQSIWVSKPNAMSYADFRTKWSALEAKGVCLLQRRMGLGPSPEFCMLSIDAVPLPEGLASETRAMAPIGQV